MNKQSLLESIKSKRPSNIKIDNKVTKLELIRGIFEEQMKDENKVPTSSDTKDMMELHDETQTDSEGFMGTGDIVRKEISNKTSTKQKETAKNTKEDKSKKPKKNKAKEDNKKIDKPKQTEPSGKRVQKTGLRFATDLGFKAVALNDEFKKMSSPKEIALQSMFNPNEISKIIKSNKSSWNTAIPKQFYCREKNLTLGGDMSTTIPCWRTEEKDKVRMANQITKGVLSSYYTRKDADGEKRFKHPKSGEVWVPMGPRTDDVTFSYLPLTANKNVVAFSLPNNEDDIFIAPMTTKKLNFLFNVSNSSPEKKPSSTQNKNTDSDDKSEQRAGEMLLDIK